jgi:hypothetical protein
MVSVGDKKQCPICHKCVEITELIPDSNSWYMQKLSCGDKGKIWIPNQL